MSLDKAKMVSLKDKIRAKDAPIEEEEKVEEVKVKKSKKK